MITYRYRALRLSAIVVGQRTTASSGCLDLSSGSQRRHGGYHFIEFSESRSRGELSARLYLEMVRLARYDTDMPNCQRKVTRSKGSLKLVTLHFVTI